jgi:hypothetical protein
MQTTDIHPNPINTNNHSQLTSGARNGAVRAGTREARSSGPQADCPARTLKEMRNTK